MDWKMSYIGPSSDERTNRWLITPPCGHKSFEPHTTRFSTQHVECQTCGIEAIANYNDKTIRECRQKGEK